VRKILVRVTLILLAGLVSLPSWASLNHNHNSIKALAKAYGFLLGQEKSLKRIEARYPALRLRVEMARLTFSSSFAGVRERLEDELRQAMGEANFGNVRAEMEKQIGQLLDQQALTVDTAAAFLEKVKARAKGEEMEVDVLRYLLAVKYAKTPIAEFHAGFRQRFSTDGSGKAQGIRLTVQLPRSWLEQEGERPHIVKKWSNEGGTGLSTIVLAVRGAAGQEWSAREIDQFVKSGEARQTFSDLGKVHDVGTFSLGRRKGYWAEISMNEERAGFRMYLRGMLYQLFFRGKTVGIMCIAAARESEPEKADAAASLIKPVCQQVLNSLVLEQAY
jgi:hypothetical protein